MTVDEEPLDLGRPLRGIEQLAALVAHVHRAHPKNETDWLEWKTGLDLTSAAGRFEVARQILGFANRDPDAARRHAGGLAYLILGIEPGSPCGQSLIDNADLTAGIGRYIVRQGPIWSPLWVTYEGVDVLVVTVEAPQWGDPIHTLQRDYEATQAGAVFVRRPGRTDPSGPDDIKMLERRLVRGSNRLESLIVSPAGGPVGTVDMGEETVERWLERRREEYLSAMRNERTRRALERHAEDMRDVPGFSRFAETTAAAWAGIANVVASFAGRRVEEDRTPEQFEGEVDSWIDAARPLVAAAAATRFLDDPSCQFTLAIDNPTERNVPGLHIEMTFPEDVMPIGEDPDPAVLPVAPRPWGPRIEGGIDLGALNRPTISPSLLGIRPPPPPTSGRTVDGQVVVYWLEHLRPGAHHRAKPIRVLVTDDDVGQFVARWSATSSGLDGIISSEVTVLLGPRQGIEAFLPPAPR